MAGMDMSGWRFGFDGVAFGTFNRQGGRRGEKEFRSQNWIMAMAMRPLQRGMLTLTGGLSAEPLTVGKAGYSEIFQVGEAYRGLQVTDRQHPHDLIMQLAAAWRAPLAGQVSYTLAGGVGEPALGPPAFIHRASSAENPSAPLSHHIFDSTHITFGVVTLGLDRGPLAIEGSVFRGREPDEDRYDFDFGELDSWSARLWFRPRPEWAIQGSYGYLHEPEELEPGDQRRTNASVSWFRQGGGSNFTAVTAAVGRNVRPFSTVQALLLEFTRQWGRTSVFSRYEALSVETEILLFPQIVHRPHPGELVDPVQELTSGIVRDVADIRGFQIGIGGDVVFYRVPEFLQVTHDPRPVSFHMFVRLRPPARGGRMWNMTLGQPMGNTMPGMTHEMP
jgi:hypothetical protein